MKKCFINILILILVVFKGWAVYSQGISIYSIKSSRNTSVDSGYTLDGLWMRDYSRKKLINENNFGSNGIYNKSIKIIDTFSQSGSITNIGKYNHGIFFFGHFDINNNLKFTNEEIDSLYNWSKKGGKIIITPGFYENATNSRFLDAKWGFNFSASYWNVNVKPNFIQPTSLGLSTDIFDGPFGKVTKAMQGGSLQGCFENVSQDFKVLATELTGKPSLLLDCNTLDLVIADVDVYTAISGIFPTNSIVNQNEKILANTIVFMDKLQPPPYLLFQHKSNKLYLNSKYNYYQWFYNGLPIIGANDSIYFPQNEGEYSVEIATNGGCILKSNVFLLNHLVLMPNVFTPNNDGVNDTLNLYGKNVKLLRVRVFNRWGEILVNDFNPVFVWDGKYKNELVAEGNYIVLIDYIGETNEINHLKKVITILR